MTAALKNVLERATRLSDDQQDRLAEFIEQELKELAWDEQIERDVKAGKLDKLMDEALRDHREGKTLPMP